MSILSRVEEWARGKRVDAQRRIAADFSLEEADRYVFWHDFGFFRHYWSNLHKIAEGAYRSNFPNARRFDTLNRLGIKTVINLRGGDKGHPTWLLEEHMCRQYGMAFHTLNLNARQTVDGAEFVKLLDLFDTVEKPFLLHCKSGADRAGLASAMYLIHAEGASVADARSMLSIKYAHISSSKTGIMGFILTCYERAQRDTGISLRDWFETQYDAEAIQAEFDETR